MRRLLRSVTLLATAAHLGCGQSTPRDAWQHLDLTTLAPRVELSPFSDAASPATRSGLGFLGAREMRNLALVPPQTLATYPHQSGGQVRVLEQVTGSRLGWTVRPSAGAYLSLTPMLADPEPRLTRFRAGVRAEGSITVLADQTLAPLPPPAPPVAPAAWRLDLERWAGEEVELLLQVDAVEPTSAPQWVRWASPALWRRGTAPPAPGTAQRPNVILLGIDTLRADAVGAFCGGCDPSASATPAIDALAKESDLWLDAYSTFNVTNPSFASILTGLYGKNHGVYDLKTPLPAAHTTLAELFKAAGYDTLAVISARHLGDHNSGLGQGFDLVARAEEHNAAELAVETAIDWIAARRAPFFTWVHLFDPHTPHTPPRPFAEGQHGIPAYDQPILAGHRDLYRGEVEYLDHQIARLLEVLESRGLLDHTILALVADHGENLGEHGILYRHIGLWETTTHVPLLVRWPHRNNPQHPEGRRLRGLVQTLDLFPTLLAAAGLEPPPSDGIDLSELTRAGKRGRRAAFSEDVSRLGISLRTPTHRLVKSAGNPAIPDGVHLYDLEADPGETNDLAGRGLALETELLDALTRWLADHRAAPNPKAQNLSQDEIDRLRSLGYL